MSHFAIPHSLSLLRTRYPLPSELLQIVSRGETGVARIFAQMWLSEGIPAAFGRCPAVYDVARTWLAERLSFHLKRESAIHPKDIGVVGSARLGRSLAPAKMDRCFGDHSDLDLFVVSGPLFEALRDEFVHWKEDFGTARVLPRNDTERRYWGENSARGEGWIGEGFIDSNKVPTRGPYPIARGVGDAMYHLKVKLDGTPQAPNVRRATVRCYANWQCAIDRMRKNLKSCVGNHLGSSHPRTVRA